MEWIDIASIVFVCVTMNHLGLVAAVEEKVEHELPILNCPKCSTMWCTFVYTLWHVGFFDIPLVLAISFLASYAAIWLELFEGYIDTLYMKLYGKIYQTSDNTTATDTYNGSSADTVS